MLSRFLLLSLILSSILRADPAVLNAWLKRQSSIQTLETRFTQERKLPSLKQPVSTPGRLAFSKPGQVRWQLGEPAATLVVVNGKDVKLVDYNNQTLRNVSGDSPQAARYSMLSGNGFQSREQFDSMFEITAHRVESGIHQYTLKPKERRMRSQVPWVFLDIDPAKLELRAMEMELKDKSRIRTVFHDPKINTKLSPTLFTVDPTGLKVK
jgi:outer membrane lipoprotein-sorting protein